MLICIFICMHLPLKLPALTLTESRMEVSFSRVPAVVGERILRPRVSRSLSLAQRKAGQSQVLARCQLAGVTVIKQIGQTGRPGRLQGGSPWGRPGESSGGAGIPVREVPGRYSNREGSRQLGLAKTSAYRRGCLWPRDPIPKAHSGLFGCFCFNLLSVGNQTSVWTYMACWEGKSLVWTYQHELCYA